MASSQVDVILLGRCCFNWEGWSHLMGSIRRGHLSYSSRWLAARWSNIVHGSTHPSTHPSIRPSVRPGRLLIHLTKNIDVFRLVVKNLLLPPLWFLMRIFRDSLWFWNSGRILWKGGGRVTIGNFGFNVRFIPVIWKDATLPFMRFQMRQRSQISFFFITQEEGEGEEEEGVELFFLRGWNVEEQVDGPDIWNLQCTEGSRRGRGGGRRRRNATRWFHFDPLWQLLVSWWRGGNPL